MPPRTLKGALIILLVGATASFLDKFASREEFTVGELRKIRHEGESLSGRGRHDHCKGQIHRAWRDDVAATARTYLPKTWPRERSCEPAAIQRSRTSAGTLSTQKISSNRGTSVASSTER